MHCYPLTNGVDLGAPTGLKVGYPKCCTLQGVDLMQSERSHTPRTTDTTGRFWHKPHS